ncbi:Odorant receptor 120, partial [Halyomorpha halys]
EKENPYTLIRLASAIVSLFFHQYLISYVSEVLTDELENLRLAVYSSQWYNVPQKLKKNIHLFLTLLLYIPTLRTIMGTKTNMENLSQILNTSYCYFNIILTLKSRFSVE